MMEKFETVREFEKRWWDIADQHEKIRQMRFRHVMAFQLLKAAELTWGDKLRATAARCNAHEASFEFWFWNKQWLVSRSKVSIAPASVYSINGTIVRLPLCPVDWCEAPRLEITRPKSGDDMPF